MNIRKIKDSFSSNMMFSIAIIFNSLFIIIAALLAVKSAPLFINNHLLEIITGSTWNPSSGNFGLRNFIYGTAAVTFISVIISAPLSILTAIFIAEYAPKSVSAAAKTMTDIFAGIPSVVYGIWGVISVVPAVSFISSEFFGISVSGYSLLSASLVLAIMIFPIMVNIITGLIESLPVELKETAYSLGATKWQTVKFIILKKILPGIIASVILGITRAFGETMAVLMVAGNVARESYKLFEPVYTIPALIANNYGELMSIPMYDSALMFASLLLLLIVLIFNSIAHIVLNKITRYNA
jgi:phosphate transport system permease protein